MDTVHQGLCGWSPGCYETLFFMSSRAFFCDPCTRPDVTDAREVWRDYRSPAPPPGGADWGNPFDNHAV